VLSYSSMIQRVALILFFCALVSGCSTKGAADFKRVSRDYFGCAMTAPWPLEVTSRDSSSVSFIRLDDVDSLPIYFRESAGGSWPELSDVPESNIVSNSHVSFDVRHVNAPFSDIPGRFDRRFVIIIKQDAALVLPEESGDYWQLLLNSCDKMKGLRER